MFCPDRRSAFPFPWPFFYLTFWKLCSFEKALTSLATTEQYIHQACITSAQTQFPGCILVIATHCPHGLWWAAGWQTGGQVLPKAADTQQQQRQYLGHHKQLLLSPLLIPSPASKLLVHELRHFQRGTALVSWASWRIPGGGMEEWRTEGKHAAFQPPAGLIFPSSSSHLCKKL